MDEILRPMGRGRGRARARSPTRPFNISTARPFPTRSESPERRSSSPSTSNDPSSSAVEVATRMESLVVKHSSSSFSSPPGNTSGVSAALEQSGIREVTPESLDDLAKMRGGAPHDRYHVPSRPEGQDKIGKKGTVIPIKANYYEVKTAPTWALYEYRVDFTPELDQTLLRKKLFKTVAKTMDFGYIFDGTLLRTPKEFTENLDPNDAVILNVESKEGTQYDIKIKGVGQVETGSPTYISFYNLLLRRCMYALNMEPMGRNFFDPTAAIELPAQRLTLWPGFVTSIRHHEQKILLCVETTHKVLRLDSALHIIKGLERSCGSNRAAFIDAVTKEFKDTIVMTSYNRKTYHVDGVTFDQSPTSTFELKNGLVVTLAEYYKSKYDTEIKDLHQPLLIAKPSKRDMQRGDTGDVLLVPELCQSTGLTDAMRANFSLMKELAKYLHQGPQEKARELDHFMRRMLQNETIQDELNSWGMQFDSKLVELNGRILPKEIISFANGTQPVDDKGDFTLAFRSQQMLSAVALTTWGVVVPTRDAQGVDNLVQIMAKVARPLSMNVAYPKQVTKVQDGRIQSYLHAIEEVLKTPDLQIILIILPNNKPYLYNAVNKRLAVELGVPSQCFLVKNLNHQGLMSIATKVVVQMNAKLGGEPWTLKLPLKNTMFVGFDIYHGAKGSKARSVGAMVATFSANFARYFSTTSYYNQNEDMSHNIQLDMMKCCQNYLEENGELPDRIIMYRDGVGEGQLREVFDVELKKISEGLKGFYTKAGRDAPGLTYIVVSKRINTRLMMMKKMTLQNPPPGTVVDEVVTLPERYDFYLISCAARQGTVSPCCYNVLRDENGFDADKLQLITYKMCHMYFNWSGTIAVPAPCQYAHKLAFLTGMSYTKPAHAKLSKLLHFL